MRTSLQELRDSMNEIKAKQAEQQKRMQEEKQRHQKNLYGEALATKQKVRESIVSSKYIAVEDAISRIRFDYVAAALLLIIIAGETSYLYRSGIITFSSTASYAATSMPDEAVSISASADMQKIIAQIKSKEHYPELENVFNTNNKAKLERFLKETNEIALKNILFSRNENCYYASAVTDKDRTVTFKLRKSDDAYSLESIDIED